MKGGFKPSFRCEIKENVMKIYEVTGMSCAACSSRVEKAVGSLQGVKSCSVNLLANTLTVDSELEDAVIIEAVVKSGYGAKRRDKKSTSAERGRNEGKSSALLFRLIASAAMLLPLMYISMGHLMLSAPLPDFISENAAVIAILEIALSLSVILINNQFFVKGFRGILSGAPNMDSLVSIGSGISFIYSLIVVLPIFWNGYSDPLPCLHGLYFESSAMILTLITVGKMLEDIAKGRTTSAISALMDLSPKTARIERDGEEITVDCSEVSVGDVFILRAGDSVPVDGVVIEGECSINEATLTGESEPSDKSVGSKVFAATVNCIGYVKCKALSVGEDTAFSGVIRLVEEANATKAPISKIADKVSGIFVPLVIFLSVLTFALWFLVTGDIGRSVERGITVLVISCPCALGLATPVAIMVGSGVGAKNGILYKTAESIELSGKAKTVVFDKTGTLTEGRPRVVGVYAEDGVSDETLIEVAYLLEEKSEHPQAKAIRDFFGGRTAKNRLLGFSAITGSGVVGQINGVLAAGGNLKFISGYAEPSDSLLRLSEKLSEEGKTPLFFVLGDRVLGIIATEDSLREDTAAAVNELKSLGITTVMLTGDSSRVAASVGKRCGIDRVISDVLPNEKSDEVKKLSEDGCVIMVGDGINDAPALACADVGIAIGGGTDVAIESADVVLVRNSLADVVSAVRLGRRVLRGIRQNLFFAFIYNMIGIPMAAGLFGISLSPMIGAAAMSLSSFSVVMNALRINSFDNKSLHYDDKNEENAAENLTASEKKGEEKMEITLKVEGMMCPHCEARVKEALSNVEGVESAFADHKSNEAKVVGNVDAEVLVSAVETAGYKASVKK